MMFSLFLTLTLAVATSTNRLGTYKIDKSKISISGFSSGGYFSVQFHVAYSRDIMGAAVVAGGPFYCAQDSFYIAKNACMVLPDLIDVPLLVNITRATELTGTIDSVSELRGDRVLLVSGAKDSVVVPGVTQKLLEYYENFVHKSDIETEFNIPAEHAMLTDDYGSDCSYHGRPFINNCHYSIAYKALHHIYGDIVSGTSSKANSAHLLEFDQSEFFASYEEFVGMDERGYLYVPPACHNNSNVCRLHIALHGCVMSREFIGTTFVRHAGYNQVAEVNDIIVLYPQTHSNTLNPNSCFDWWGFTSSAYATKLGLQMAGIKAMVDRLTG